MRRSFHFQCRRDDIYVEMTFLRTLEVHGLDCSIRQAGIDFANSGYRLWHAEALYFEHHLNCAVRDGDWKLVRQGQLGKECKLLPWELYDMSKDRSELHDLSATHSEKVDELSAKWEARAVRAKVKP